MMLFNSWYYSFSPHLAMYLGTHQTQRTMFRYVLYPLMGMLYASYYSYLLLSPLNNELAVVTAGLIAAGMIGLVYFAPPLCLVRRILRRKARGLSLLKSSQLAALSATSGIAVGMSYLSGAELALGIATASLLLSTVTLGAILGIQILSRSDFAHPTPQIAALLRAFKSLTWRLATGPDV